MTTRPSSVAAIVRRAIDGERERWAGEQVLVAVSGGVDSIVLLDRLARERERAGHRLHAVSVHHGLRPEADVELATARARAEALSVPFTRVDVLVRPGANLQERARTARHEALRSIARELGATSIALAHHGDDRAETVLMRVLRGAGAHGLAALAPRDGVLVRPLLRATRSDIVAYARRHRLPFHEDPSNADRRFLRARVRHDLMPVLAALDPAIGRHLNDLADELEALRREGALAPAPTLEGKPLSRALRDALAELSTKRSPAARVWLPGGRAARWSAEDGAVVIEARGADSRPGSPRKRAKAASTAR